MRLLAAYLIVVFFWVPGFLMADPIGEVYIGGNTWCELQWEICPEEMIVRDTVSNIVYIVWTYAPPPPYAHHRRSYFNRFDPESGWAYEEPGYAMFPGVSNRENHSILLLNSCGGQGNLEIGLKSENPDVWTMRAWWADDHFEGMQLDTVWFPEETSVRRAFAFNRNVNMAGIGRDLYNTYYVCYGRYSIDPFSFEGWLLVDTVTYNTYKIAASPVSEKVAIVYLKQKSFEGPEYYYSINNDIYLVDSQDGTHWDWESRINLTQFAEEDVFRPIEGLDIFVDYAEQVHIAFAAREAHISEAHPESTHTNMFKTYIWHWCEAADSFSVVADGWIEDPPIDCFFGLGSAPVCKPEICRNPANGYLYILYERNNCEDHSFIRRNANADIWASVSTDNGLNWSVSTNLTDTQTPDCLPEDCASEIQFSIEHIVNDTLHIVYILDRDAGIYEYNDGTLQESKVVYQKIPANLIPAEPLITQFSIRTGPPTDIRDVAYTSNPRKLLISQNYPNPFNAQTTITYMLPASSEVSLYIFDITGRVVRKLVETQCQEAGAHKLVWDGTDSSGKSVSTAIYFYELQVQNRKFVKSMILIK